MIRSVCLALTLRRNQFEQKRILLRSRTHDTLSTEHLAGSPPVDLRPHFGEAWIGTYERLISQLANDAVMSIVTKPTR
jgi:hypothetical protein